MAKKILIAIFSILLACALGFCVCWTVINFNKVKEGLSGTGLYTQEDIDNAYKDGYNTAVSDKSDLLKEIETLRTNLSEKETRLKELEGADTENIILKQEKADLQKELDDLKASMEVYKEFVEKIEAEGELVVTYKYDGRVIALENYKENETLRVAFDIPEDTDNIKLVGWEIDDVEYSTEGLKSYAVTKSVVVNAKLEKIYEVRFLVPTGLLGGAELFDRQFILENSFCSLSDQTPDKDGYTFKGWSLDRKTVLSSDDICNAKVTCNLNYIALFEPFKIQVTFKNVNNSGDVHGASLSAIILSDISDYSSFLKTDLDYLYSEKRYLTLYYCFDEKTICGRDFIDESECPKIFSVISDKEYTYFEIPVYLFSDYEYILTREEGISNSMLNSEYINDFTCLVYYLENKGYIEHFDQTVKNAEFTVTFCLMPEL